MASNGLPPPPCSPTHPPPTPLQLVAAASSTTPLDTRGITCGSSVSFIDTSTANLASEMYVVTYTATDSRGRSAVPFYRFVVVTSRCQAGYGWCSALNQCGILGAKGTPTCIDFSGASSSDNLAAFNPLVDTVPVDTTPPSITILGNGTKGYLASGDPVMMDSVLFLSSWTDPGATALDVDAFGNTVNVTSSITFSGAVDTSQPTPPSQQFGFLIDYEVRACVCVCVGGG